MIKLSKLSEEETFGEKSLTILRNGKQNSRQESFKPQSSATKTQESGFKSIKKMFMNPNSENVSPINYFRHNPLSTKKLQMETHTLKSETEAIISQQKRSVSSHNLKSCKDINDSDLQSQMDDYMIDDKSQESPPEGFSNDSSSSCEDESQIFEKMEKFYDKNYNNYLVMEIDQFQEEKIWKTEYDSVLDLIYVFVAKIKRLEGEKVIKIDSSSRRDGSETNQVVNTGNSPKQAAQQQLNVQFMQNSQFKGKYYNPFEVFQNSKIELNLELQIWNVDDRVIKDKEHCRRPIYTHTVFIKQLSIEKALNLFETMDQLQNEFQSFAQIVQNDCMSHLMDEKFDLKTYDVKSRVLKTNRLKFFKEALRDSKTFRNILHIKDNGKITQHVESILSFHYSHQETTENAGLPSQKVRKGFQKLHLVTINYNQLLLKSVSSSKKSQKVKFHQTQFLDEGVLNYFDKGKHRIPFFLQRIQDSNIYMLIFPTGLLITLSYNPFHVQAKLQLNLKKDETIIDFSYCKSDDLKNHCVWFMDSKLHIWKCSNELNPNSSNWILTKITMFEELYYKKFLQPAMTYHDFHLCTSFNKMECFRAINFHKGSKTYDFIYNGTSTRCVIVMQPKVQPNIYSLESKQYEQIQKVITQVYVIGKKQNIILNHIPPRVSVVAKLSRELTKTLSLNQNEIVKALAKNSNLMKLSLGEVQDNESLNRAIKQQQDRAIVNQMQSNEVIDVILMRKVDATTREFLIRRQRSLEIMYTNGLFFWKKDIKDSEVSHPMQISNLLTTKNFDRIYVFYKHNENQESTKCFRLKAEQYEVYEDNQMLALQNQNSAINEKGIINNVSLDKNGLIFEVITEVIQLKRGSYKPEKSIEVIKFGQKLIVKIPSQILSEILFDSNNYFKRVTLSPCQRVLMCGRVIIRFTRAMNAIERIGCILQERCQSQICYKFKSLLDPQEKKEILSAAKLIKFKEKPLFPKDLKNIMYLSNCIDDISGETSIIQLNLDTFNCLEVYQSKFKIIHISIFEIFADDALVIDKNKIWHEDEQTPKEIRYLHERQILISLVSQSKNHINIEIIKDYNVKKKTHYMDEFQFDGDEISQSVSQTESISLESSEKNQMINKLRKTMSKIKTKPPLTQKFVKKAKMEFFLNISVKNQLQTDSEVGWINKNQLILTLNNDYYILNLKHRDLTTVNDLQYGVQQVNMHIFCSIVRRIKDSTGIQELMEAQQCIQRMEIASLRKFAFLRHAKSQRMNRNIIFFTPAEELNGANIFSKLSNRYSVVQPYLEKIDSEFILNMNKQVQNIAQYLRSTEPTDDYINQKYVIDNIEQFVANSGKIHMYQVDIAGLNAIDYAFKKNAILCIKSFVETLLILDVKQHSFRNCFDKAILMMINRHLDVKELINSELFYPNIWREGVIFSQVKEPVIIPYNGSLADMEQEDPNFLFNNLNIQSVKKSELFEMQFNYIYMKEIQGKNKIEFSRVMKDCSQLDLFEQEVIKIIIDYKWNTFVYNFFLLKFVLYAIFLVFYYWDLESVHEVDDQGHRVKDPMFYASKSVCITIQAVFSIYELMQIKNEGHEYFMDFWNYFEVAGMYLFFWAAWLDITGDTVTDRMRIIFSCSVLMSLVKVVYLIRVFKHLNFLATMLVSVCNEVIFFFILFTIFLLTFAECFHIMKVDVGAYGRTPQLMGHVIATLRSSMGDFAMIDPWQTFDRYEEIAPDGNPVYRHSLEIVYFTFLLWVMAIVFLFMIFMNFIIAVIGDSYDRVIEYKEAHDYQQRVMMIYEREIQFSQADFEDQDYFPAILIVRKRKDNAKVKGNWQGWVTILKGYMKTLSTKQMDMIQTSTKEQKQHLVNSIKTVENDIQNMGKDIEKLFNEVQKVTKREATADSGSSDSQEPQDHRESSKRGRTPNLSVKTRSPPASVGRNSSRQAPRENQTAGLRTPAEDYNLLRMMEHLSQENQELKNQMQMMMELQKQNQHLIKNNVWQLERYQKEQNSQEVKTNTLLQALNDQISQTLHSPKTDYFDFRFLSMKGQEVMNRLDAGESKLPMTRQQVKYPISPKSIRPKRLSIDNLRKVSQENQRKMSANDIRKSPSKDKD